MLFIADWYRNLFYSLQVDEIFSWFKLYAARFHITIGRQWTWEMTTGVRHQMARRALILYDSGSKINRFWQFGSFEEHFFTKLTEIQSFCTKVRLLGSLGFAATFSMATPVRLEHDTRQSRTYFYKICLIGIKLNSLQDNFVVFFKKLSKSMQKRTDLKDEKLVCSQLRSVRRRGFSGLVILQLLLSPRYWKGRGIARSDSDSQ